MLPRSFVTAVWSALAAAMPVTLAAAKDYRLTLSAAPVDRAGQVVTLSLPEKAPGAPGVVDATGRTFPPQVDAGGHARFIVPWQPARAARYPVRLASSSFFP